MDDDVIDGSVTVVEAAVEEEVLPSTPQYVVVGDVIGLDKGRYTEQQLEGFDIGFLTRSNHIIIEEEE